MKKIVLSSSGKYLVKEEKLFWEFLWEKKLVETGKKKSLFPQEKYSWVTKGFLLWEKTLADSGCVWFFSQCIPYIRPCERFLITLDRTCSTESFYFLHFSFFVARHCNRKNTGGRNSKFCTFKTEKKMKESVKNDSFTHLANIWVPTLWKILSHGHYP